MSCVHSRLPAASSWVLILLLSLTLCQGARERQVGSSAPHVRTLPPAGRGAKHNGYTLPGALAWGCNSLTRGVVLSFDDGPAGAQTLLLLDTLRDLGLKATFFVCGAAAAKYPEVVKQMAADGHEIGSHSWSHANMTALAVPQALEVEIVQTEELILNLTGRRPVLFRPPYGAINNKVRHFLRERGYTIVVWSGGCIDWFMADLHQEALIMMNSMADAGGLLVMHDSSLYTCQNIGQLAAMLQGNPPFIQNPQGRRIITMRECLNDEDQEESIDIV